MLSRISVILVEVDGCLVGRVGSDTILPVFRSGAISPVAGRRISYDGRGYGIGDALVLEGGAAPTSGPAPRGLDLKGCPAVAVFLVG